VTEERDARRLVVYTGGGDGLELPPAMPVTAPWIGGGIRTLHELAFAAAASGWRVELRGPVLPSAFERLAVAAGVRPELPDTPRRPAAEDLIVIPEGYEDPWSIARVVLSQARGIMMLLAPPGLFGWPFVPGKWSRASPLIAERAVLARPEHFRGAAELGLTLWTHMPRMAQLAHDAGVPCRSIGNGSPSTVAEPPAKRVDVAWLQANRWAPLAESVATSLGERISVDAIEEVEHDELLARVGAARVLLWPSRIEGHARIAGEARLLGCVPVALASNEFATGLDEASGAVVVDTVEQMRPAVEALLRDPARLAELAERGRRSAAIQLDWDAYAARVGAALYEVEQAPRPDAVGALAGLGERLELLRGEHERLLAEMRAALAAVHDQRDHAQARYDHLKRRKAVRFALWAAELRHRRVPRR